MTAQPRVDEVGLLSVVGFADSDRDSYFFRVRAAFLAERDRSAAERLAAAL